MLAQYQHMGLVSGCDEAGRGCLAGPVVAAAVILPKGVSFPMLNDSKKLTTKQREKLFPEIKERALTWGVGIYANEEIDEVNILNASFLSMHRALDCLSEPPALILVDGNRFIPYNEVPHECIVKGDGKYLSIAAASVIAKVTRDHIMTELHQKYPEYGWNENKGYPTKKHRCAIRDFGPTEFHRKSFRLLPQEQLALKI